jgi:hypothetical protein
MSTIGVVVVNPASHLDSALFVLCALSLSLSALSGALSPSATPSVYDELRSDAGRRAETLSPHVKSRTEARDDEMMTYIDYK